MKYSSLRYSSSQFVLYITHTNQKKPILKPLFQNIHPDCRYNKMHQHRVNRVPRPDCRLPVFTLQNILD